MKKLAILFLLAGPALGQAVNSDQLLLKSGGGLAGDSAKQLSGDVYRGTSAPSSPVTGQLWWDTNASPPTLKTYDGSSWVTPPTNRTIPIQASRTLFPVSPVDGQMFFARDVRTLYVYNGTDSSWYALRWGNTYLTTVDYADSYSTAVLGAPGSAATATRTAGGGTCTAGAHSVKITYANSTGGETTGSTASGSATCSGGADSISVTSIPTGPTGTTQRRVYVSKAGQDITGPWYWSGTVSDNSTTTFTHTGADASLTLLLPAEDFSAPLPAGWTYQNNTASTTSGGAGGTADGAIHLNNSTSGCKDYSGNGTTTSDPAVKIFRSLASFIPVGDLTAGGTTVTFRVVGIGQNWPANTGITQNPVVSCMRYGTADNATRACYGLGRLSDVRTMPISGANIARFQLTTRDSIGAGASNGNGDQYAGWPQIDSFPFWVRWVRRGCGWQWYRSQAGGGGPWSPAWSNAEASNRTVETMSCYVPILDTFEMPIACNNAATQMSIKFDSFTVVQDEYGGGAR